MNKKKISSCCELCVNYVYDEDSETYECMVNLDEDEVASFFGSSVNNCNYFRLDDEYGVVRKQI